MPDPATTTPPVDRPAVVRVGDWVVYPRLCRATRAGREVHLRSQVVDLLVVLARRANRMMSKEDVTAALWPGVHVSGSGLSRCMAELRQVFEDDAKNPWLIETIAKRGYRVIAPVVIEEETPAGLRDDAPVPDDVSADRGTEPGSATPSRRRVPWVWMAVVIGVALVAALAIAGVAGRWRVSPPLAERHTVVLADIANTTGDTSLNGALRLALAVQLEQAPFLRIISDERVRETLALMKRAAADPVVGAVALEVCRRENAGLVLASSIARLGTHLAIGVEATECGQGESIARVIEEIDSADGALDAVGRLAATVRQRLGESAASVRANDVPVARATTASLDALRAFSLGDAKRDEARFAEALDFYRQATTIDPQFAVAWARLGAMLTAVGRSSDASQAYTTAVQLAGRTSLPERAYITANYHFNVTGRVDQAAEALETCRRLYPGSATASILLAGIYVNEYGRYQEALDELRAAEPLLASNATRALHRAASLLALGRLPDARQALQDPRLRGGVDPLASQMRAKIAWREGDRATLDAEFGRAASAGALLAYRMLEQRAEIAMVEGRGAQGRRLYSEAVALAMKTGGAEYAASTHLTHALAEAAIGDIEEATRAAGAALQLVKNRDTGLRAALVFALSSDRARARQALDFSMAAPVLTARTDAVWLPMVDVAVEAIDRPADALVRLDATRPYETGLEFLLVPLAVRVRLLDRAQRWPESEAACRKFLKWQGVNLTSPFTPLVQVSLARALAHLGDRQGSRAAYESFLASWRGADLNTALLESARAEYNALGR